VSRVALAPEISEDFDRTFDHLDAHSVNEIRARIREIIQAFDVLESNPLIGRLAPLDKRELIIGRGSRGYVALHRYVPEIDTVFVLALRSQSEAGYRHE
jgi:plasmid stabilization system protein ParE